MTNATMIIAPGYIFPFFHQNMTDLPIIIIEAVYKLPIIILDDIFSNYLARLQFTSESLQQYAIFVVCTVNYCRESDKERERKRVREIYTYRERIATIYEPKHEISNNV